MEIGTEKPTIVIEPVVEPTHKDQPAPAEPVYTPEPVEEPELIPA